MTTHTINTTEKNQLVDITSYVTDTLQTTQFKDGLVLVFTPHTTAAITITENADMDVKTDLIFGLNKVFINDKMYQHFEGNSDAHMKSSVFGVSEMLVVEEGKLVLGTWQGIYFCEFDGPRTRQFIIKTIKNDPSI